MTNHVPTRVALDDLLCRAESSLESDGYPPVFPDDAAPLIVRMLALAIEPDRIQAVDSALSPQSDWPRLAHAAHEELTANPAWLLNALVRRHGESLAAAAEKLVRSQSHRLAWLAADLLTSQPLAPPVRLPLEPESHLESAGTHAILFEAWPHATHEVFPLLVDALSASARGTFRGEAVAAHTLWLCADGSLRRASRYDPCADRFVEADLVASPAIRSAHLLLGPGDEERDWHARWHGWCAERRIALVNPAPAAQVADDKCATHERWQRHGIPTPETWLLPRDTGQDARACVIEDALRCACQRYVVKPRHGTEGKDVAVVTPDARALETALSSIMAGDDALIQPYRNCLRWVDGRVGPGGCCAAIRLNVALRPDGEPVAESGYAHVATDGESCVASVGQGGKLMPLARAHLFVAPPQGPPRSLSERDVRRIVALAQDAARALAEGVKPDEPLRLVGVDLIVDVNERGDVHPLALEANPRPAGLSHSRFLADGWNEVGEPGVSLALWEGLESA